MFTETIELKGDSKGKVLTTLEYLDSLRGENKTLQEIVDKKTVYRTDRVFSTDYIYTDEEAVKKITDELQVKTDRMKRYEKKFNDIGCLKSDLETKLNKIPSWIRWLYKAK